MYRTHGVARGMALMVMTAMTLLAVAMPAVAAPAVAAPTLAAPALSAERSDPPPSAVAWGVCPADVEDPQSELQCAWIPVPLDYTDPAGVEIEIMISRLASLDPGARRGVLMLNQGGPGESGLTQPLDLVRKGLPVTVTKGFDLIGMDTRGIKHSAPISCGFTVEQGYTGAVPRYAADSAAVAQEAEVVKSVAA